MSRKSAYQLRNRDDAASLATAWDEAVSRGRDRIYDYMLDRALNGVTTFTIKMGGAVEISHGMDRQLVVSQLKSPPPNRSPFGLSGSAGKGDKSDNKNA